MTSKNEGLSAAEICWQRSEGTIGGHVIRAANLEEYKKQGTITGLEAAIADILLNPEHTNQRRKRR